LAKVRAGHLVVLGLLAAALCVAAALGTLRWLLSGVPPGSGGIGIVAGGFGLPTLACAAVLLLVSAGLLLFGALRGGRLK